MASHNDYEDDEFEPDMVDGEDEDGANVADGDIEEELLLENDSIAYFDGHKDSVFAIAQHPLYPALVATGGGEGDADDAPGKGYVIDTSAAQARPLLPSSYSSNPDSAEPQENTSLAPLFEIDGHTDSINALAFTQPSGDFLVTGGLDGRMRVYGVRVSQAAAGGSVQFAFLAEAQEVPEINWIAAAPTPAGSASSASVANTVAIGGSDGSVWVYTINPADTANPLQIVKSFFLHTESCTAGAWTPDGNLLATVSEDSSLHVWDVWGVAAARGLVGDNGQTVVSLTAVDQRFEIEGGIYSVAVSPGGGVVAVGGAGGVIKVVSLPRLAEAGAAPAKAKGKAGKKAGTASQAGVILASPEHLPDGVETLAFAPAPLTLLAAGSVDGSVVVFDASHSYVTRRKIPGAHGLFSVVKVDWVKSPRAGWLLTSCGMDGLVRRWNLQGTSVAAAAAVQAQALERGQNPTTAMTAETAGLVKEWRGHRGDGAGGGVLGFVQGDTGERVVTAGDDGLVLVFEA